MPLHPITVVNHVLDEYRSYLRTEFRARDPELRAALEAAIDERLFLAQEPFFQAHRPFASSKPWADIGLDAKLARVMEQESRSSTAWHHQAVAIEHLLSRSATPLVVTTGTGSGKTECFLLPVLQNAIEDATAHKKSGLTSILVYPMNALANDQEERIAKLLALSGHTHLSVARYDRQTSEEARKTLRANPPHILLTNYVMLEYLLVRPADRNALFANHRCRYLVLDEVHSYRGALGANVALLFRRLLAHLRAADQDWNADDRNDPVRFPAPVPVATSATIKSVDEAGRTEAEIERLRDDAVQDFFSRLTGVERASIKVVGEKLRELEIPTEARWNASPVVSPVPDVGDPKSVAAAVASLAGLPATAAVEQSGREARVLWVLNALLARKPMSVSGMIRELAALPERAGASENAIRAEVELALAAGAALPDDTPGQLRLRAHRFVRGGWSFHRCVDPTCGRLSPNDAGKCTCGHEMAPLYLCRSCGTHVLRFRGDPKEPNAGVLVPNAGRDKEGEWLLYDTTPDAEDEDDGEEDANDGGRAEEMRGRKVHHGSFDPDTCSFSSEPDDYRVRATLAPARGRCLVCGANAGVGSILTPVALGTSAAVRVLSEGLTEALADQNRARQGHDSKERLLIFADSRQDAAHQARFISYAGRYDRMRRRVVRLLADEPLSVENTITRLVDAGVRNRDNPLTLPYTDSRFLNKDVQAKAAAWEAAPLLDDLAVSAGYRATVFNLGLVGVRYEGLDLTVRELGPPVASTLGLDLERLAHLCRCLLDEIRRRGALSHPLLTCHPANPSFTAALAAADWERKTKGPSGYAYEGEPGHGDGLAGVVTWRDRHSVPPGVTLNNAWRQPKTGGLGPSLERRFKHLVRRFGGAEVKDEQLLAVLKLLASGARLLHPVKLGGWRKHAWLLQLNVGNLELSLLSPHERFRCSVCNVKMPWVAPGAPCPACHGTFAPWPAAEAEESRYLQRIRNEKLLPLVAAEHTAQVAGKKRAELEEQFKAAPTVSPLNVLACSPTLEMGINIGGLDAVVMRNVPPRPDNYAQRGGRAGRATRVGVVMSYTRNTPHDGYFFDKPQEMIAGEVRSPGIGLGNRDVVVRHLNGIAFGAAEPGLSGRMGDYITLKGELVTERVEELITGVEQRFPSAVRLALAAWGPAMLEPLDLNSEEALAAELAKLPARVRDLFDRVRLQVRALTDEIDRRVDIGRGAYSIPSLIELRNRLLGLPSDRDRGSDAADDRSSGHPMRRFAEFGILPGYEFPAEPCTVRLLNDVDEEETLSVERRFGLAQYQPEAKAHARGHRWKVTGLDMSSPWNPKTAEPGWIYVRCKKCDLRYPPQSSPSCPRCGSEEAYDAGGKGYPGFEYGGFIAKRDDTPVLEEEDRFATAALVQTHPQHDGRVIGRWLLPTEWTSALRREEHIRWVNEWKEPSKEDLKLGVLLHDKARGFYLCGTCGESLTVPRPRKETKGRSKAATGQREDDDFGHRKGCLRSGQPPVPHAITTKSTATTLRIEVVLPPEMSASKEKDKATDEAYRAWGNSLGYALRSGLRLLYMLDGAEIGFELEPAYTRTDDRGDHRVGTLTFIDAAVGGSGFLDRAATELDKVAQAAIEHLDHPNCETACYRCLKSYQNQRLHTLLSWPLIMPELEQLASAAPRAASLERGDEDDPRPWLEAYDAGVGSPLELRFLRVFEAHGIDVQKQVPMSAEEGGPIISIADFVVTGTKTAIYVDGASFHRGNRLRRDRAIRKRLREGGFHWRVVELSSHHLAEVASLVAALKGAP